MKKYINNIYVCEYVDKILQIFLAPLI